MMALFRENAKTLTHCLENYIMHNAVIFITKILQKSGIQKNEVIELIYRGFI